MDLECEVVEAIVSGAMFLFSAQYAESFWCAELEANLSILSDYVTLRQVLNLELGDEKKESIIQFYTVRQNRNGSWSDAFRNEKGAVSSTAEAYLVLRILGVSPRDTVLSKASKFIVSQGGLNNVPILTRIKCAMFGLVSWDAIPTIPAELVLLPSQLSLNLQTSTSSSWTRSVLVPLQLIYHHRPVFSLPNGTVENPNAWLPSEARKSSGHDIQLLTLAPLNLLRKRGIGLRSMFLVARNFLFRVYENHKFEFLREYARKKCTDWILQHEEDEKSKCFARVPYSVFYSAVALTLEGHSVDSRQIQERFTALQGCCWPWENDSSTCKIQYCKLSIWDTASASLSLLDCGWDPEDRRLVRAILWLLDCRLQFEDGDWRAHSPHVPSEGCGASEQCCKRYPDVRVTAAVLISLIQHKKTHAFSSIHIERAIRWCLRLQNSDGGWPSSDAENLHNTQPSSESQKSHYHSAPSTPDVTGHVMEALGLYLKSLVSEQHSMSLRNQAYTGCQRGSLFLQLTQDSQGPWSGMCGVSDMYSTTKALCGLANVGARISKRVVFTAINWLKKCQNTDGGWGEHGKSTPSRTAWAVIGLISYLPAEDDVIERGARWLIENQTKAKSRYDDEIEVVRYPVASRRCTRYGSHLHNNSYLCGRYFPMIALGRFLQLRFLAANTT